jgi:hypothetical protein
VHGAQAWHVHGHEPLLPRIWKLRDNLTAYDAARASIELIQWKLNAQTQDDGAGRRISGGSFPNRA